jgi:ribosomal protein L37AE/L43A
MRHDDEEDDGNGNGNGNPICPICQESAGYLGRLGQLIWFRCIHCGFEFALTEVKGNDNDEAN